MLVSLWKIAIDVEGDPLTRVVRSPQNPDLLTTKRIVALEGDLVRLISPHPGQRLCLIWTLGETSQEPGVRLNIAPRSTHYPLMPPLPFGSQQDIVG